MNLKAIVLSAAMFASSCAATKEILAPRKCRGTEIIKICNAQCQGHPASYVMSPHREYGKICNIERKYAATNWAILMDHGCDDTVDVYFYEDMWEVHKLKRHQKEKFFETELDPLYRKMKDCLLSAD